MDYIMLKIMQDTEIYFTYMILLFDSFRNIHYLLQIKTEIYSHRNSTPNQIYAMYLYFASTFIL
jgi:hypothetical protein